jgi:hypothetical protein
MRKRGIDGSKRGIVRLCARDRCGLRSGNLRRKLLISRAMASAGPPSRTPCQSSSPTRLTRVVEMLRIKRPARSRRSSIWSRKKLRTPSAALAALASSSAMASATAIYSSV